MSVAKIVALLAVSAALMAAIFALSVWLGASFLLAVAAAGLIGGVGRYALYQWLKGDPFRLRDAIVNGVVTAIIGLASGWLGDWIAPALSSFVAPVTRAAPAVMAEYVPKAAGYFTVEGLIHGPMWSGAQAVDNVAQGRPIAENAGKAFEVRAITFPERVVDAPDRVDPLLRVVARAPHDPPPPEPTLAGAREVSSPPVLLTGPRVNQQDERPGAETGLVQALEGLERPNSTGATVPAAGARPPAAAVTIMPGATMRAADAKPPTASRSISELPLGGD